MKFISLKALSHLLLASCLVFTSNFALADAKIPYEASSKQQVINLNSSTLEQLVTLKGIGQIKAQAILVYREQVGAFKSIDDLIKVKGIGEKVLMDNKSRLRI